MGFFSKLFIMMSAALGLFVSGLDLLERFDVDVNAWLRGIPPVVSTVPESYSDWVDRFSTERLGADREFHQAPAALAFAEPERLTRSAESGELILRSQSRPQNAPEQPMRAAGPVPLALSGGLAALAGLVLVIVAGGLFRRRPAG